MKNNVELKEQRYFSKVELCKREMALPNRMSLRPGLLWLTLNLALISPYVRLLWLTLYIYIYIYWFVYPLNCLPPPPGGGGAQGVGRWGGGVGGGGVWW
jgi:hypothetical protein